MSDPFQRDVNQQLMREAKFGLAFLALTVVVCSYFIYRRIQNQFDIPDHVRDAPAATMIHGEQVERLIAARPAPQNPRDHASRVASIEERNEQRTQRENPMDKTWTSLNSDGVLKSPFDESTKPLVRSQAPQTRNAPEPVTQNRSQFGSPASQAFAPPPRFPGKANSNEKRTPIRENPAALANANDFSPASSFKNDSANKSPGTDFALPNQSFQGNIPKVSPSLAGAKAKLDNSSSFAPKPTRESGGFKTPDLQLPIAPNTDQQQKLPRPIPLANDETATTAKQTTYLEPPSGNQIGPTPSNSGQFNAKSNQSEPENKQPLRHPSETLPSPSDSNADPNEFYLVQQNESLWSIAQKRYEDGRWFRALHAQNQTRLDNDGNPIPGSQIHVPPMEKLQENWPALCNHAQENKGELKSKRVYVTHENDTLFELARQRLGQASRYLEILEMNRFRLPRNVNHLTPLPANLKLILPGN